MKIDLAERILHGKIQLPQKVCDAAVHKYEVDLSLTAYKSESAGRIFAIWVSFESLLLSLSIAVIIIQLSL